MTDKYKPPEYEPIPFGEGEIVLTEYVKEHYEVIKQLATEVLKSIEEINVV